MGKIKRFFKNMPLKMSFMLYMLIFLLTATILSAISIDAVTNVQNNIWVNYEDQANSQGEKRLIEGTNVYIYMNTPSSDELLKGKDKVFYDICSVVNSAAVPFFFAICIIAAGLLFYRNKLKKPLELLSEASEKIAQNDLDFTLSYSNKNELGRLCDSFEKMRSSMYENNRNLWRTAEERKRLNAAFSHDLRTPLTVLRGYTDYISRYLPEGKIPEGKLLSTVQMMDNHITRLEHYVQGMNSVQKLEEIEPNRHEITYEELTSQLKETAEILCTKIRLAFIVKDMVSKVFLDTEMLMQVYENLVSNAVRYAESSVTVCCSVQDEQFILTVSDDGKGFTNEAKQRALEPFFRDEKEPDKMHFGLGLYICKILCEKQNGSLTVENSLDGGGIVTAQFGGISN